MERNIEMERIRVTTGDVKEKDNNMKEIRNIIEIKIKRDDR